MLTPKSCARHEPVHFTMNKLSREQVWDLSEAVAKKMRDKGIGKTDVDNMSKADFVEYDERISQMPEALSRYDGQDYDEDDCFDYFKALVRFHIAALNNNHRKED